MARVTFLLILLELITVKTAIVTENPSLAFRLDKLYEKLEQLTVAPPDSESVQQRLSAKLDMLNSLSPGEDLSEVLSEDDEEVLSAMQLWGAMTPEQLAGFAQEIQEVKDVKTDVVDPDYDDWGDDDLQDQGDGDYAMDGSEDWGDDDLDTGTIRPQLGVTPSAIIRQDSGFREAPAFRNPSISAIDPIAATNERPRVIDDSSLSALERRALRHAAFKNMKMVVHAGRCLTPQARWLPVRQMAPAANVVYMPPCVQLHRCAPDAGCCHKEDDVCAPLDGRYVAIPFYLHKADGNIEVSRMLFYNHTRCACVARESLRRGAAGRAERDQAGDVTGRAERDQAGDVTGRAERDQAGDVTGRAETDRAGDVTGFRATEEPLFTSADDEPSAEPTLMRRCTCPALFLAKMSENNCSCVCSWPEPGRRRECLSLARGREHFGLRDRVCVRAGDCAAPACEYGPYERGSGRCPLRRFRRVRYRGGSRIDKGIVVEG